MLFLSVHAVRRMNSRGITRDEIVEALDVVQTSYISPEDDQTVVILGVTRVGRRLKVVVAADDHEHIITVADRGEEE